jgi:hypothetical protein
VKDVPYFLFTLLLFASFSHPTGKKLYTAMQIKYFYSIHNVAREIRFLYWKYISTSAADLRQEEECARACDMCNSNFV